MKKSISCCLSHQNPATYLFRAVLACKRCLIWADFSPDSDQNTFSLEEVLLWICFLQTRSFCLLKMLTDGLEWCGLLVDYCDVFISCLNSHSDGTHSLHCWQTHLYLRWPEDGDIFCKCLFCVNYSFNCDHFSCSQRIVSSPSLEEDDVEWNVTFVSVWWFTCWSPGLSGLLFIMFIPVFACTVILITALSVCS